MFPRLFGFAAEMLMVLLLPVAAMYTEFTSFDPFIPEIFHAIEKYYGDIMAVLILTSLGIITYTIVSLLQARSGKRMGTLTLMTIGSYTSSFIGLVRGFALYYLAGMEMPIGVLFGWVSGGLLVSLSVAFTRQFIKIRKQECFSTPISAWQSLVIIPALLVVMAMSYGESMDIAERRELHIFSEQSKKERLERDSAQGLEVLNLNGYTDRNGDFIITGSVNNTSNIRKSWFLVANVFSAEGMLLAKSEMVNGRQRYSYIEYEILTKKRNLPPSVVNHPERELMPKSTANFEMRIIEPIAGIQRFTVTLQPTDFDQLAADDLARANIALGKEYGMHDKTDVVHESPEAPGGKDLIDRFLFNVYLDFNYFIPLHKRTKEDIFTLRRSLINEHQELELYPDNYLPDQTIYSQIDNQADWVQDTQFFIANPYLLVVESAGEYVDGLIPYCPASSIVYSKNKIIVRYDYESAKKWFYYINDYYSDSKGVVRLWFVNALDAGFRYAHVDVSKSVNIEPVANAPADHVMNGIYASREFYHVGRYKKNNISPNDGRAKVRLIEKNGKTVIYIKLWKNRPVEVSSKEDFSYIIEVVPGI